MVTVFDNTSCDGIYKLGQRVMVLFFETPSTALAYPGSDILDRFGKGNNFDSGDVNNLICMALAQVKDAILTYDGSAAIPDDEKLKDLKLKNNAIVADHDKLTFQVEVISVSGAAVVLTIPYTLSGGQ